MWMPKSPFFGRNRSAGPFPGRISPSRQDDAGYEQRPGRYLDLNGPGVCQRTGLRCPGSDPGTARIQSAMGIFAGKSQLTTAGKDW
jgi:hypothetical protein